MSQKAVIRAFETFHAYEARRVSQFERPITVPERLSVLGFCKDVLYRSDKWNDGTHEYIHEITSFPRVRVCAPANPERRDLKTAIVPPKIRDADPIMFLGKCLGFTFVDEAGETIEAKATRCDWFWSPTGKALYCIEDKRRLVALIWGGKLDVEARGIVG